MNKEPIMVIIKDDFGKDREVYNFENKTDVTIIYEILELKLPNGNKHTLLLELLKRKTKTSYNTKKEDKEK